MKRFGLAAALAASLVPVVVAAAPGDKVYKAPADSAIVQDNTAADEAAENGVPVGGESLLLSGGEMTVMTAGASVVGTTIVTTGYMPCWISNDSVKGRYRIVAGDTFMRYTSGGRVPTANAFHDSTDCGQGVSAGSIGFGQTFEFFINNAYHVDEVTSDGGRTFTRLRLDKYCQGGCAEACTDLTDLSDSAYCDSTTSGQTWKQALDLEGDTDACHAPDLSIASGSSWYPTARSTVGYLYLVEAWVCDANGTNCTYTSDSGCVDVTFN